MLARLSPLLLIVALAACQTGGPAPVGTSQAALQACTAASGYTARAEAARASGVEGEVVATAAETAALNACVQKRSGGMIPAAAQSRPVVPAQTGQPARRGQCSLTLVGGTGYACAQTGRRY